MNLDYHELAASGAWLHERIQNGHTSAQGAETSSKREQEFIEEAVVADLRAQLNGDFARIDRYFGVERWPEDEELPEWVERFDDLMAEIEHLVDPPPVPTEFEEKPFVHVLWPLVSFESDRIFGERRADRVTEAGRRDLEGLLLDSFVDCTAQALHVDFMAYIDEHEPELLDPERRSPDSRTLYDAYVTEFIHGRAGPFFEEFAVAARFITTVSRQWRSSVTAFLSRLEDDSERLESRFGVTEQAQVSGVSAMGDPHDEGRQVFLVEFDDGTEILYKPRNVDPGHALYEFQSWLARTFDDVPDFQTPEYVVRSSHGWVEKVEPGSFDSFDALEEYYRGAGALLCVFYVLNMSDCHMENIIATERSPTPVDGETVLELGATPARSMPSAGAQRIMRHVLGSTVLGTQMLPFGTGRDRFSGLELHEEQNVGLPVLTWKHVNTDAVDVTYEKPTSTHLDNVPSYAGESVPAREFVEEIAEGFETTYDAIADSKPAVIQRLHEEFTDIECRLIFRATRAYYTLLKTLTTPKYLRDGALCGYKIQHVLSQRVSESNFETSTKLRDLDVEQWDRIVESERTSIQRRDVPKFTIRSDDVGLYYDNERLLSALTNRTGRQRAREKIERLSPEDRQFQVGLVRACLKNADRRTEAHPEGFT